MGKISPFIIIILTQFFKKRECDISRGLAISLPVEKPQVKNQQEQTFYNFFVSVSRLPSFQKLFISMTSYNYPEPIKWRLP